MSFTLFVVVHSQNDQLRSVSLRDFYVLDCVQMPKILKHMVVGFTTTYAISADVVSSNLDQSEVYNSML
jgi:hypothetical protein